MYTDTMIQLEIPADSVSVSGSITTHILSSLELASPPLHVCDIEESGVAWI